VSSTPSFLRRDIPHLFKHDGYWHCCNVALKPSNANRTPFRERKVVQTFVGGGTHLKPNTDIPIDNMTLAFDRLTHWKNLMLDREFGEAARHTMMYQTVVRLKP